MILRWGDDEVRPARGDDLVAAAPALAAAYNEPSNMERLGHTAELSVDDVVEHYGRVDHGFLLYADGALAGDADLRDGGEFAFLIAAPSAQGKGLGTRFATMIHAHAFLDLGYTKLFAAFIPSNTGSRRVFEKLGYGVDTGSYGDEGDVVMSIERDTFLARHAAAIAEIVRR